MSKTPFIYSIVLAAGQAFMEAAQLQINLQSKHEAGQRYVDAGNCFKKTDVEGMLQQLFLIVPVTKIDDKSIYTVHLNRLIPCRKRMIIAVMYAT